MPSVSGLSVVGARPLEWATATLVTGLTVSTWVALASAHGGRLNAPAAIVCGVATVVASALIAARAHVRHRRRAPNEGAAASSKLDPALLADLCAITIAAIGVWTLKSTAAPLPAFFDASWYLNSAAGIARFGSLEFRSDALAIDELRAVSISTLADQHEALEAVPDRADRGFHVVAFSVNDVSGAVVHPYHPPFVSASLAMAMADSPDLDLLAKSDGRRGTGESVGPSQRTGGAPDPGTRRVVLLWSLAYLLAVGTAARAAFGAAAAPIAVAAVAAGPAFAYYGAAPFAEVPAGALAMFGAACLVRLAREPTPQLLVASAAGLSLGFAGLAKLELVTASAIAVAWWVCCRRRHGGRAEGAALALGMSIPLVHLALLAAGPMRTYVELNLAGVVGLLGLVAGGLVWGLPPKRLTDGADVRGRRARLAGAALILGGMVVVSASAYSPSESAGVPNGPALLLWLATPLVAWAAAAIAAAALMQEAPPPGSAGPPAGPPSGPPAGLPSGPPSGPPSGLLQRTGLLTQWAGPALQPLIWLTFASALGLLLVPGITTSASPLYTARRFVPLVLPCLTVLAAGAAVAAAGRGPNRGRERSRTAFVSGAAVVLVVAALAAQSRPVRSLRDFEGGAGVLARVAAQFEPGALVVFPSTLNGSHAGRIAAPLWTHYGVNTVVLRSPDVTAPDLAAALAAWRTERNTSIFVVTDELGAIPELGGWTVEPLAEERWLAPLLATDPTLPPKAGQLGLSFDIARLVPGD